MDKGKAEDIAPVVVLERYTRQWSTQWWGYSLESVRHNGTHVEEVWVRPGPGYADPGVKVAKAPKEKRPPAAKPSAKRPAAAEKKDNEEKQNLGFCSLNVEGCFGPMTALPSTCRAAPPQVLEGRGFWWSFWLFRLEIPMSFWTL